MKQIKNFEDKDTIPDIKANIEKDKEQPHYELVEVPVQTSLMYRDTKEEKILDDKQALLEILNILKKIEKSVT